MRKKKDRSGLIYSDDHYKVEKILKDKKFQGKVKALLLSYQKFGHPVSKAGFSSYQEYLDWSNLFHKAYARKRKTLEIVKLPQLPGEFQEEILKEFKLNPRENKYSRFIEEYLFFNKKHLSENTTGIVWRRNEQSDAWELYIRIYPHTKLDHIHKIWNKVTEDQKLMDGYIGKNKKWETFSRDLEIYDLYMKEKEARKNKRSGNREKTELTPLDEFVMNKLGKKYSRLTLSDIRKARTLISKIST